MITPDEYRQFTHTMAAGQGPDLSREQAHLLLMSLGLGEEAGEVQGNVKKMLLAGMPTALARAKILKEAGDVLFYLDRVLNYFAITFEDAMEGNRDKLLERYPNGYDAAEKKWGHDE